jgi:hypothetical protein
MKLVTPPSRFEDEDSHRATSALAHILRMCYKVVKTYTPPAQAPEPPADTLQGVTIDGKAIRGVGRDEHPCLWSLWCSMPVRGCLAR